MDNRLHHLADVVTHVLLRPVVVTDTAVEFAEAAFGTGDANALRTLLADIDDPDGRVLFEYLLFPGEQTKLELEPELLDARLTEEESERLVERVYAILVEQERPLAFSLPDAGQTAVPPDRDAIAAFIDRLRPWGSPPKSLEHAARETFTPAFALRVLVLLRHARMHQTPASQDMLLRLMQGSGENPDTLELLHFACLFLEDADHTDLPGALRERYEASRNTLTAHERFQESFAHSNFEIQRLQGGMPAHVDVAQLRRETRLLSRICMTVYGEPVSSPDAPNMLDLGGFSGADGAQRLIDLIDNGQ